ncbi:MAG: sulfatase-like hydrolase/transferase, partial [Verrucomicrobiales bacterium]|nr:sulfatase-like hydrolase/transferase [Verrucomicrobiales bacterium]
MNRFLLLLLTILPIGAVGADQSRPNILWILVDDMSANFSCYGEKTITTPHVDKLAGEGLKF